MQIDPVVGRGSSGLPHIHNNSLISKFHSTEELSIMTFPFYDSKSALMFEKREWLSASLRCFKAISPKKLEIDRHIGLPIFFQIFEHFTIIGYRFCKKKKKKMFFVFFINFLFFFICHIHNYTEYNQQWNVFSAFDPFDPLFTQRLMLRKCSSTATACYF